MIAGINGKLTSLGSDWAIIDIGGLSFQVYMPTSTMSELGSIGQQVKLHTHFYLREDNATLYGFAKEEELVLFQLLIGVSGLGPRLALAMLSAMNVERLSTAIATENIDLLKEIPGIGKKMAERLVLELKEKIGAGWVTAAAAQVAHGNAEVVAALTSLGYSIAEATHAVASLPETPEMNLEEKIKLALAYFGGK